jgi:hypothetical protein
MARGFKEPKKCRTDEKVVSNEVYKGNAAFETCRI